MEDIIMIKVLLDNKDGNVWDISEVASSFSWSTSRNGKAGKMDFTLIESLYQDKGFKYNNGDIIRVSKDGVNMFYGYIFSISGGKEEEIKITAYDQVRYLMMNDTYLFRNMTATDILKKIAGDFGLSVGVLEDTGYKIPSLIEENKQLLDIIYKALTLTLINTGKNYVLFDDFGQLSIRNIESLLADFVIGDESLLYDYDYSRSIDDETYNRIKLSRNNQSTGKREIYIVQDSANIAKWGKLQHFQTVDENMNEAQINEQLNQLIELKNRERKTMQLQAIGDPRVRAGYYVPVIIEQIGINQYFLVDECTHKIEGEEHTMTLKLKVI